MAKRRFDSRSCPHHTRATEFLVHELSRDERAAFLVHLEVCDFCQNEVARLRSVVTRLEGVTTDPPAADIADLVLRRIPAAHWSRSRVPRARAGLVAASGAIAAVAVLAVILASEWPFRRGNAPQVSPLQSVTASGRSAKGPPVTALASAREWLAIAQEDDGRWAPERWGGDPEYTVALTALAALALSGDERADVMQRLDRAIEYLLTRQDRDGHLGPRGSSSLYNHAIGTLALVELEPRHHASLRLKEATTRALDRLLALQTAAGAWGYQSESGMTENESITFWGLRALIRADVLGRDVPRRSLTAAFEWFERSLRPRTRHPYSGRDGHECGSAGAPVAALALLLREPTAKNATAHAALDRWLRDWTRSDSTDLCYYDTYFLARTVEASGIPELDGFRRRAEHLLTAAQIRTGALAGSWEPEDRWSPVGGRLYATALAALALDPGGAAGRDSVKNG